MNAKELKTILNENRNVFIKMNEWIFVRKLDSAAGKEIHVFNNYRPEKSEFFIDVNEGVKFFTRTFRELLEGRRQSRAVHEVS